MFDLFSKRGHDTSQFLQRSPKTKTVFRINDQICRYLPAMSHIAITHRDIGRVSLTFTSGENQVFINRCVDRIIGCERSKVIGESLLSDRPVRWSQRRSGFIHLPHLFRFSVA